MQKGSTKKVVQKGGVKKVGEKCCERRQWKRWKKLQQKCGKKLMKMVMKKGGVKSWWKRGYKGSEKMMKYGG